uniref:Non-structural protein 4 n=1 Tax=African horse sickness virus TaxID=40050 RepID=A0A6B9HE94_AHSV|nr:non-structural protein 4 [African horse sickness virus]
MEDWDQQNQQNQNQRMDQENQQNRQEEMEVEEQGAGLEGEEWAEWLEGLEDVEDHFVGDEMQDWANLRPEQIISLMMMQHAMLVPVRYHLVESLQEVLKAEEGALQRVVNLAGNHWIGRAARAEIQDLQTRRQRLMGAIDGMGD